MISVEEARRRIVGALRPLPAESIGLERAHGRVLAADVAARRTQPPKDVSAMDGWAVRAADVATVPATLTKIGEAPAGAAFDGRVDAGQTVRIFTGAPVPEGADSIVIQENAEQDGDRVTVRETAAEGTFIRRAGLDFQDGEVRLTAGHALTARDIGLAAAMNVPWLDVRRKPRVALLATGDELVRPGEPVGPNQIVSSNAMALAALIDNCGGEAIDLGIARDNEASLKALATGARGADMLVTLGGASVGDHDLVQSVLGEQGLDLDFWRIAMRPGKPLMFGQIGDTPMLGLPGNPVSSLVCGLIFLRPALFALLGRRDAPPPESSALLGRDLEENDRREDYLRASLVYRDDGQAVATPFERQDSSMLSFMARADCLVVRRPHAPAEKAGATIKIVRLDGIC